MTWIIDRIVYSVKCDGALVGPARMILRALSRGVGQINARVHGFEGFLPLGSQVSGLRNVIIAADFRAHGRVWIEAIEEYAGTTYSPRIVIGHSFRASDRLHISAIGSISIGDNCLFGSSVFIGDHAHGVYRGEKASHPSDPPAARPLGNQGDINIGDNCWIGDNVTIVGPVDIGSGAIVAANSVVTKDIRTGTLVAGVPARPIKTFDSQAGLWLTNPR